MAGEEATNGAVRRWQRTHTGQLGGGGGDIGPGWGWWKWPPGVNLLVIFALFCKRLLYQNIFHRHYSYSQYIYHSKPIQQVPFLQLPAGSLHHPRLLGVGSLRLREGESRKWGDGLPPSQAPGWLLTQPSALSAIEHHSLTHNLNHVVGRHASRHFQSSDLEPLYR